MASARFTASDIEFPEGAIQPNVQRMDSLYDVMCGTPPGTVLDVSIVFC
jgi:hypothetical protein